MRKKLLLASSLFLALAPFKAQALVDPIDRPTLENVSFSNLPVADRPGRISIPNGPTFEWEIGQHPSEYLPAGYLIDGIGLGGLTLNDIGGIVGYDALQIPLSQFEPLEWQTIGHLRDGVPELQFYTVGDVQPLFDALEGQHANTLIANLPADALETIIPNLENYTVKDIPNLSNTPLHNLDRVEYSSIQGLPGVDEIPFGQFPIALSVPTWAKVDITYGHNETTRATTITGSTQEERWDVPCEEPCAYLEMTNASGVSGLGPGDYHGKHYIAGDFQQVKGGWAGTENNWVGGYEPTGQLPFGKLFKISAADLTEQKGSAELRMNFRYCQKVLGKTVACTPYGFPDGQASLPFLPVSETSLIPVMWLTGAPSGGGDSSQADNADVDTSEERTGETGGRDPVTGENIPDTGSTDAPESQAEVPEPEEPEVCELDGSALYKPVAGGVTSAFGYREHPKTGRRQLHNGMDIGAPAGAVMGAAECGKVTFAGWKNDRSGNVVTINHTGNGPSQTQYVHLQDGGILVNVGDEVERGQPIGKVGSTGLSTGPHLHWIVRENGTPQNPANYI